jgi:hypothetical protein
MRGGRKEGARSKALQRNSRADRTKRTLNSSREPTIPWVDESIDMTLRNELRATQTQNPDCEKITSNIPGHGACHCDLGAFHLFIMRKKQKNRAA